MLRAWVSTCFIILAIGIPVLAADRFIAVDTPQAGVYGELEFDNEAAGFSALLELADAGVSYGFANASAGDLRSVGFMNDPVDGDYLQLDNGTAGMYYAGIGMSFGTVAGSENVHCAVFVGDEEDTTEFHRKMSAGGDLGVGGMPGLIPLFPGDKVRIKCSAENASKTISIDHLKLVIVRISAL